jgi:hypothetical protein
MTESYYQPDYPADATDMMIVAGSGPEPSFDAVMQDFLCESFLGLKRECARGGLLGFASLGRSVPWVYRLAFCTRGFTRDTDGEVVAIDRHVVALRFLPDYLRNAERFAMLRLIEPVNGAFHPNISISGAICVEIYPGESLVEICHSLHDLFRWRLRQYDERDALNPAACAWGRQNVDQPIDDRPLFGQRLKLQWQAAASA